MTIHKDILFVDYIVTMHILIFVEKNPYIMKSAVSYLLLDAH